MSARRGVPAAWSVAPCPNPQEVNRYGHVHLARCNARSCSSCGHLWLGDTRVKVLAAAQQLRGAVALVTITGPGEDVLPFEPGTRSVIGSHAAAWNATAPERWSSLHRCASTAVARDRLVGCPRVPVLIKVWEYQRRGILHLHLVLPVGTGHELRAANAYVAALVKFAPHLGFGYVDRGKLPSSGPRRSARSLVPVAPWRAAAYVAGYVVSTGAGKPGVAEVARRQGVPGAVVYVSPTLTRRSGCTMRSLRQRRTISALFPGAADDADHWRAACLVHALSRRRAPLTPQSRDALVNAARQGRWTCAVDEVSGRWISPTAAAAPSPVREAVPAKPGVRRTGRVRLDLVLHDGIERRVGTRFWTGLGSLQQPTGVVSR